MTADLIVIAAALIALVLIAVEAARLGVLSISLRRPAPRTPKGKSNGSPSND